MAEYVPGLIESDKASIQYLNGVKERISVLLDAFNNTNKAIEKHWQDRNYVIYDSNGDPDDSEMETDPTKYGFPKEVTAGTWGAYNWVFKKFDPKTLYTKNGLEDAYWFEWYDYEYEVENCLNDFSLLVMDDWIKKENDVEGDYESEYYLYPHRASYDNKIGLNDDAGWSEIGSEYSFGDAIICIDQIISALQERVAEQEALENWQDEGGKSMRREQIPVAAEEAAAVCGDIADAAIEGVDLLKQATGSKAPELIKRMSQVLKSAKIKLENTPGIVNDDIIAIESQVDDLDNIAGRQHFSDIRSWDAKAVQKEDARLVLGKIHQYWKNVSQEYTSDQYNRRQSFASKTNLNPALPNYRFKVGQMVKVGNRYGKVVGAAKEGGTGKHVYEVKINGADKVRRCSANEMKSVDVTTKNTSNLDFV